MVTRLAYLYLTPPCCRVVPFSLVLIHWTQGFWVSDFPFISSSAITTVEFNAHTGNPINTLISDFTDLRSDNKGHLSPHHNHHSTNCRLEKCTFNTVKSSHLLSIYHFHPSTSITTPLFQPF